MKNYKLIVSDVDGTLLNEDYLVSEETKVAVKRLKEYDIDFAIATGRAYEGALDVAQQLDIVKEGYGIICLNGMRTYHLPNETYKSLDSMTYEQAQYMQRLGQKYYMGMLYCYEDVIFYEMEDHSYKDYELGMDPQRMRFFKDNMKTKDIDSLLDLKHRFDEGVPLLKIVYVQGEGFIDLLIDRLKDEMHPDFDLLVVGTEWLGIMPKRVNKGEAVLEYAKTKHISADEIMAFGDAENDISMLKAVGCGVAVENAFNTLKAVADDFTESNLEHGVAKAIHRYLDRLDIEKNGNE